jgi:gluconate 2-dehydrogenase alpha chain
MAIEHPDVCIVGLGAAGGVAALVLAEAGLKVVALEAGPHRTARDFPLDELSSHFFRNSLGAKFNNEKPSWRPDPHTEASPHAYASGWGMANAVGGGSVHYQAQSRRFFPDDFRVRSNTLARYGEEALPTGSTTADWPVSYDDLDPYYDKVEYVLGVSGAANHNPFDGPRSRPYPLPPLRPFLQGKLFAEAADGLGLHPYRGPAAIITESYQGRQACTYCGWCGGMGCYIDAKSSTLVSTIPRALATGNLQIRTHARVIRLYDDGKDRVTAVEYVGADGTRRRPEANTFILSSYTLENVRLLVMSSSERFPRGLTNNHGQVGRNFMTHQYPEVTGVFEEKQFNRFTGPAGQHMAVDDWNADNFDHGGLGFLRGGTILIYNELYPITAANTVPPGLPAWGRPYKKKWLLKHWNSTAFLGSQADGLSTEHNFLDLDPHRHESGPLGLPVVRITYKVAEDELRLIAFLQDRMANILRAMGADQVWKGPMGEMVGSAHEVGGLRMGNDPGASAVDRYLRAHEAPNLLVLGGSVFPTQSGQNPTETIQALAWWACEHLVRETC